MLFLLACTPSSIDSALPANDTAIEHESWEHELSIVHEGSLIHDGSIISIQTAPAGIDQNNLFSFVISNLTDTPISFSDSWMDSSRLAWHVPPPSTLDAYASHPFSLQFNPKSCTEEEIIVSDISIPNQDMTFSIETHCPPPLRIHLLGDDGFGLISDDYGSTFSDIPTPEDLSPPLRAQSLAWGDGMFLRAFALGNSADSIGVYQYSEDAIHWNTSQDSPDYAPSDCTYGLGRFVCTRADSISWSTDGRAITHEPALGDFRLNQILYRDNGFIAVGRGARRVRSEDAQTWSNESFGIDPDTYHSLVQSPDIMVAAGGINRYFISYSTDHGITWEDVPYGGCQGNYIQSLVYHNGLFLAQGASSCHHNMHRSSDGINWEPVFELHPFDRFVLLGAINGYFIAHASNEEGTQLYRSSDGYTWVQTHILPQGKNIRLMTAEEWSP
jgi:hypothetical protein